MSPDQIDQAMLYAVAQSMHKVDLPEPDLSLDPHQPGMQGGTYPAITKEEIMSGTQDEQENGPRMLVCAVAGGLMFWALTWAFYELITKVGPWLAQGN